MWKRIIFIVSIIQISWSVYSEESVEVYRDEKEIVEVRLWKQDYGVTAIELIFKNVQDNTEKTLRDTRDVESVSEAFANDGFFVIIGRTSGGKSHYIWIVDRVTHSVQENLLC